MSHCTVLVMIIHVLALFWGIRFPFQAQSFGVSGRNRYLHIAAILLGLIFPCVPIGIILGTGGFEISRFPPIICAVASRDALFYSTLLPIATLHSKIRIVIMTTVVCYGVGDDEHITCIDTAR